VHALLAIGLDAAERHPVDVQVAAAVNLVLNRVKSPRVSSVLRAIGDTVRRPHELRYARRRRPSFFYENEPSMDIDNIPKPISDALK
jgi:hypothetical protein